MKRVAIIEKDHFEVAATLLQLFDHAGYEVIVFIYPDAYHQLRLMLGDRLQQYTWVVKEKQESNRDFIRRLFTHIRSGHFDLVYGSTIDDNFILYARHLRQIPGLRFVLTLHMINHYFHYHPALSLRRLVRYFGKKQLLSRANAYTVLSAPLTDHLQRKVGTVKPIYTISGSAFSEELYIPQQYQTEDTIRIVVPGSVDSRRRDYSQVFALLTQAAQLQLPVHITLLGAFRDGYSEDILQHCRHWLSSHTNLVTYDAAIDQPEFDRVLGSSHFIWMPLQPTTIISDGVEEIYGTTICSGNTADVIRHARPSFAPSFLQHDNPLVSSCIGYAAVSDIINVLQQLSPATYHQLQEKALAASRCYTIEKLTDRNRSLFS